MSSHSSSSHSSSNTYIDIDKIIEDIVVESGCRIAEHSPRTIDVDSSSVAFVDVHPRRDKGGAWCGVNVSTVTIAGDCHTIATFTWRSAPPAPNEVATFTATVAGFLRRYVSKLVRRAPA